MKKSHVYTTIHACVVTATFSVMTQMTSMVPFFPVKFAYALSVTIRSEVLPPYMVSLGWLNTDQEGVLSDEGAPFQLNISPTCFPSNLRWVYFPVHYTSTMQLTIEFLDSSDIPHQVVVMYPALLHFGGLRNELINEESPPSKRIWATCATCAVAPKVSAYQGTISLLLQGVKQFTADSTGHFNFPASGLSNAFNTVKVARRAHIPVGTTQELVATSLLSTQFGPDLRSANVSLSVGGTGDYSLWAQGLSLCYSFVSPLMLFFDQDLPRFSGNVRFRFARDGEQSPYFWPERGAKGYFLALDRNGNGKIDSGEELFGNNDSTSNGFDVLREFDKNKDGIIDDKDPIFSKLLLWRDVNSDGISQKSELHPLKSKKVKALRLNYENRVRKIGRRAEIRQSAKFEFLDKKDKVREGDIHDVWFAPGTP